jgi:hypothetical protein
MLLLLVRTEEESACDFFRGAMSLSSQLRQRYALLLTIVAATSAIVCGAEDPSAFAKRPLEKLPSSTDLRVVSI